MGAKLHVLSCNKRWVLLEDVEAQPLSWHVTLRDALNAAASVARRRGLEVVVLEAGASPPGEESDLPVATPLAEEAAESYEVPRTAEVVEEFGRLAQKLRAGR